MKTFTHEQAQEILRSGVEASGGDREGLTNHLSACAECQAYAALVAELGQVVPRIYPLSLLSAQEIHRKMLASQPRLRRQSMLTLISRSTRTVIWLGASLVLVLVLIILSPRLIPNLAGGNPTLTPLASVNASPAPELNATPRPGESIQYTVAEGENLFSIADKFGLKPETILWVNPDKLADSPANIKAGMVLRIPAVDGLYYRWKAGDNIEAIASRYGAALMDILRWPENAAQIGPVEKPDIQPGMLLFIPGGKMPFQPVATMPANNTPSPAIPGASQGPVLPDTSYVSTIVRAPIAWRKSTGQGVNVGVIQNHQEKLHLVNLIAPGAVVIPFMADDQFKIDGKSPEMVLTDQNIRLLVISQPGDFDPQVLRQTVTALATANIAVFVNADLTPGDDQVALMNDLEALGAITVGQLDGAGIARGSDLPSRKINLFAPCGFIAPTGNAAQVAAGVGALILADEPALTAEAVKKRLVETADPMWQASDPATGQWKPQNVSIDPVTGDYSPAGNVFQFKRVNAANALGQTLDNPWPVNALNAPAAWKKATGKGVKVAVIDQGFHVDNPAFQGHLVDKAAFVSGRDFGGRQNFHGTSMAKIVLSVAPDASLVFLLLDETGSSATIAAEVKAIDYAIASGVDVITNSNGSWANTPEVHAAIDRAIAAGIVFVWFGYDGTNPAVIRPGYFWNSYYDVGAFDRFFDPDKPVDLEGGLSDTAPQIAGIAALVLQNEPQLSPMEVKQRIIETAAVLPNGCSLADAAAAVENRPSGIKMPERLNSPAVRGQIQVVYSLPGEVEKKTLVIHNSGTQTLLPVLPGQNVILYRYRTNVPGEKPYDLLIGSNDGQLIAMGFFHEGALVSGEAKPSYAELILEKGTRLRADLSKDGIPPIQMTAQDRSINFHWANPEGVLMMTMDNQTGQFSSPSGAILYQLDAEGDLLPLVNVFQGIY